jgi:hypothetical protein
MGAKRLQPGHSAWEHILAGLLGAHRICVRAIFDLAERPMQHPESHRRVADYFCGHAGFIGAADTVEEAPV